jgi:hypothetical protein
MTPRPPEEDTPMTRSARTPRQPAPEQQPAGSRAPAYVIELCASPELRARNPGRPLSLAEALQVAHGDAAGRDRDPEPELEAEP